LEKEGLEELTHCGFILIAGGLGERLGYHGIKVGLPIETFSYLTYLNWYIKKILAIQHRSKDPNCHLPFAIMTSENNNEMYFYSSSFIAER
jgi:UTP-monosaccharide-1-phosphate uridylyltransferase